MEEAPKKVSNFIKDIVEDDLKTRKHTKIITRFPPEPNGYLHLGHAKSICLNFGLAKTYGGECNLRFDDTNPSKEDMEYIDSIQEDIKWLGFTPTRICYASDYYDQLYAWAEELIQKGLAYVCSLNTDEIRDYRGTLTTAGKNSPDRDRSIEENLDLFRRMKNGEFKDGEYTLRAKIDMASPNMNFRDPAIYRIKHESHPRTGDKWCIYPMYDFAHGESDAIEHITHSICTLEFEDHRPLYNWFVEHLSVPSKPRQIEFARLNLTYTVMSKRYLLSLVKDGTVSGWDDPRMPTICGIRRRGYPAKALRNFCELIGVSKADSIVDYSLLEHCVRDVLNKEAQRRMAVLDPIKLIIENYPEDKEEDIVCENNTEAEVDAGTRTVKFTKELYIEREDFEENPPKKWFRMAIGQEVRLKHSYYVTCKEVVKDENGNITALICTYDPETKGGTSPDGRKVKGTIHWVSCKYAVNGTVNLYEHLFTKANPYDAEEGKTFKDYFNNNSLTVLKNVKLEENLLDAKPLDTFQFLRKGYYTLDKDSTKDNLIFNRTVSLKDSWEKEKK
ncbi:MAG: glutamine--tRNA ligase/YqeY domain fusion protein [Bdellovibrionota bacterium]|nr:glutamine--tRNA ligase/YqeY domain fusion protein [Pseudomonadota bacterium]MDY6090514.1 glutamine--tRNA ligase/YqeY domain fusion protein [Bdellovibrionota bacterium]